jgi:hypothetical protein
MDSSVSPIDEIWFLRVCHHVSNAIYYIHYFKLLQTSLTRFATLYSSISSTLISISKEYKLEKHMLTQELQTQTAKAGSERNGTTQNDPGNLCLFVNIESSGSVQGYTRY